MMMPVHDATPATATFLFTDIEGSTQLLRSHRADYAGILADHHRLMRERFAANGGREIDNQGDAFFVAFRRAKDAVLAAAESQRAIAEHAWPGGVSVRVRMGIHSGEADLTADRYVGLSVHRAARISALAHGSQVLVSQSTASLLEDDIDDLPGVALRDLGDHRLKDVPRPVRLYQLDVDGLRTAFPPLRESEPRKPNRRLRAAVAAAAVLLAAITAVAVAFATRSEPPEVLPNSVVRLDPKTLEPTKVVPVGAAPDLVVEAGGYVWITHHILRDIGSGAVHDAGDRTLTRVDPSTNEAVVVGGGLAPCGLAADPSGDVWVVNCFVSNVGPSSNVVRVDATTLDFESTWPVPSTVGFARGIAYGGGWLWVSDPAQDDPRAPRRPNALAQLDPQSGRQKSVRVKLPAAALAWAEGYGDLWISNFDYGFLSRLHAATGVAKLIDVVGNPAFPVVDGDVVWAADWSSPRVSRVNAIGRGAPRHIDLPVANPDAVGVWNVAAGAGSIWAATPRDGSVWRIDPETNDVTRIPMPHMPSGVTADDNDVWVTVRESDASTEG